MKKEQITEILNISKQSACLVGYTYGVNIKTVSRVTRLIMSNMWLQAKGLALWFGQRNFLLEVDNEKVILHGLKRFTNKPKEKQQISFAWKQISFIEAYKTSIGNDCALKLTVINIGTIEFEFNIKKQKDDFDLIAKIINTKFNLDITQLKLRVK